MSETGEHAIGSMIPGHYGAGATGVVMSAAMIAAAWNVQGDPARAAIAAEVERRFSVGLPLAPNTTRRAYPLTAFWLGPRSWLLLEGASPAGPAALVDFDAARIALDAVGAALFEVSASRVAFMIRGPQAAAVLARSCPLDLDPRAFAPGDCAQSVLGRISALFYRHLDTPAYTVLVARSLAADAWYGLCRAAATDGYELTAPAPFDAA